MTDTLHLHHVTAYTTIGVEAWERRQRRLLWFDLDITLDPQAAMRSDAIEDTIDYADLIAQLRADLHHRSFLLIETLAHAVGQWLLQQHALAAQVQVTVHKRYGTPSGSEVRFSTVCHRLSSKAL